MSIYRMGGPRQRMMDLIRKRMDAPKQTKVEKVEKAPERRPRAARMRWTATCEICGNPFTYLASPIRSAERQDDTGLEPSIIRRFCSRTCQTEPARSRQRKLPEAHVVAELYWTDRLSLTDIARRYGCTPSTVSKFMKSRNIKRRPAVKTGATACIECGRPAVKTTRSNGSRYGARCEFHRLVYVAKLSRDYYRKRNAVPRERWRLEAIA